MIISVSMMLFLSLGCRHREEKSQSVLKSYTTAEVTKEYGSPIDSGSYLITEQHDEFRTSVLNCFSQEERRSRKITVREITWQKHHRDSLITVWYLPVSDSLKVLCHFEHSVYNLY